MTSAPARTALMAAHVPAGPPPITSTSVRSVSPAAVFVTPRSDMVMELVRRNRQSVVLPQRRAAVLLPEEPLVAQDGQHQLDECLQLRRQPGRHDVEAVGGATF